ncbi:hypothetical protein ACMX25_26920 [Caballeronia sp. 15715]
MGMQTTLLDDDNVRLGLCADLGFPKRIVMKTPGASPRRPNCL